MLADSHALPDLRFLAGIAEELGADLGFRTVEIRGDRFLVNGERVVFHGVNRHETHPDRGRAFDEDSAREDLAIVIDVTPPRASDVGCRLKARASAPRSPSTPPTWRAS